MLISLHRAGGRLAPLPGTLLLGLKIINMLAESAVPRVVPGWWQERGRGILALTLLVGAYPYCRLRIGLALLVGVLYRLVMYVANLYSFTLLFLFFSTARHWTSWLPTLHSVVPWSAAAKCCKSMHKRFCGSPAS